MRIGVAKESRPGDPRIPLVPDGVKKLTDLGAEVVIETGIGSRIGIGDQAFEEAGASVAASGEKAVSDADMVLRLNKPALKDLDLLKNGSILAGFLDPFNEAALLDRLVERRISGLSMELIPRTTLAQKMDALSSQANLAGYAAVIVAAEMLDKIFPMMSTPAGTIPPARVFIIGAGVAGLQAIATAKRLGAIVEAYDTRPVVEEQVRSLGGRFVKIDVGETGETAEGYAKELTEDQLARQKEAMAGHCEKADVVITTAQVFGRKAPRIVEASMVKRMKPGSVIVDLAVESGGNVEGSRAGEVAEVDGVRIVGYAPMPGRIAFDASKMYSSNLTNLIAHFWNKESASFVLNLEDEIIQGCLVTHEGEIRHDKLKKEGS